MAGRVYGSVTDAATSNLITNATVSAPPYTVTNSNGTYVFTTPGAATVDVTASAPDYIPQTVSVTVANGGVVQRNFALVHV